MRLIHPCRKIFIIFLVLLPGLYSCQKGQEEKTGIPPLKTAADDVPADTDIAGLLASMNMYHFAETVPAPDFQLPSLDGNLLSLSQFRGNVVMLSFWATW